MNQALVDKVVNAVLYEGYMLYPYRPSSVKNRRRWTFGGVYPRAYSLAQAGSDAWTMQTQCLVETFPRQGDVRRDMPEAPAIVPKQTAVSSPAACPPSDRETGRPGDHVGPTRASANAWQDGATGGARLDIRVRFLHLMAREVGELPAPVADLADGEEPAFRVVEALRVGDKLFQTWQEAVEREVRVTDLRLDELLAGPRSLAFNFDGRRELELLHGPMGDVVGVVVREQQPIRGAVDIEAQAAGSACFRVTVRISNLTPLAAGSEGSREEALLRTLVSTHTVLGVRGGEWISLLDPPERWRAAASACQNVGSWPILVGAAGERDTLLSSPIILYDFPEIAPESPGDLFDGTEIDEILTLRIMTMTEDEQREMRAVDEHARALLERTSALGSEELMRLHGTLRGLRRAEER